MLELLGSKQKIHEASHRVVLRIVRERQVEVTLILVLFEGNRLIAKSGTPRLLQYRDPGSEQQQFIASYDAQHRERKTLSAPHDGKLGSSLTTVRTEEILTDSAAAHAKLVEGRMVCELFTKLLRNG